MRFQFKQWFAVIIITKLFGKLPLKGNSSHMKEKLEMFMTHLLLLFKKIISFSVIAHGKFPQFVRFSLGVEAQFPAR